VLSGHQQTPLPHNRGTKQQMIVYHSRQSLTSSLLISPFGQQC
jgi:hypothetical protein